MFGKYAQSVKIGFTAALVISACVVDSVTIAYDGSVMGSVNVMPSYNNYFEITTATKAVNSTATSLGAILIALFAGFIVDKYGRRYSVLASALFNILGAVITASAQSLAMFIAGRMVVGLGMGLAQTAAGIYVAETTPPKIRAFALGLYYTCWAVGGILATGISFGCTALEPSDWAWRVPSLFQGFAPLLIVVLTPFLPESPRWLIHKDRLDEAIKVLARINGSTPSDPVVQVQYTEIVDTLNYEKTEGKSIGFVGVVRSAPNRRRLILALSVSPVTMLSGSNVITYYYGDMLSQAGITSSTTQMEINLILSVWQLVVALAGCLLAERLGRRILCLSSLLGCTVMFYIVGALTAVYGTSSYAPGIQGTVAAVFLFLGFYSFGLTPLTQMYPPEVLSFRLRATGMSLFTLINKACGIFVTMVFPYMFDAVGWKTYVINASWNFLFIIFVYFYWVETKGKTLEEVDELFDGVKHSDVPDLDQVNGDEKIIEGKFGKV
ncbi:unnamed protein product [Clonostachys solani]|uniref:Major facilitator superfamily (MFS) profile domain-containing protein n=1 Tax=Clonostachys solani TaxID=160281 RepID=A0A9N9Z0N6_9HYPO|nr:unnamed protein product [Clonostachys solani]